MAIRARSFDQFQEDEGSMRLFMWHKDRQPVGHSLTGNLRLAHT